jgi:cytochrome c2
MSRRVLLTGAGAVALLLAGCGGRAVVAVKGGDAGDGPAAIRAFGCGACHVVPGISGADGQVGPSLAGLAGRRYLAGVLPNTPRNLVRWIRHPQEVSRGTLMPDLGVGEDDARDIAAYLLSR